MSLLRYLKPVNRLPTADEARLSPGVAAEVNKVVEKALHAGGASNAERPKKRKYTTSFTPEDRAAIGRYAVFHDGYRSRVILVVLLTLNPQLLSQMRGPHTFVYVVASNNAL